MIESLVNIGCDTDLINLYISHNFHLKPIANTLIYQFFPPYKLQPFCSSVIANFAINADSPTSRALFSSVMFPPTMIEQSS